MGAEMDALEDGDRGRAGTIELEAVVGLKCRSTSWEESALIQLKYTPLPIFCLAFLPPCPAPLPS